MTRTHRSRVFSALALIFSIIAFVAYLSHDLRSGAQTPMGPPRASQPSEGNFHFLIAAPYWSTEDGFVSTIEMKNYHVDQQLTVTPVLYPLHGAEVILDPITLNPSETRLLNINDALASYHKHFTVGAAEIRYSQVTEGVFGANLTVLNAPKSLIYNYQFRLPEMSSRLEGLWWFYDKHTDGFVAVQNISDDDVSVTPTLYVREHPYELEPVPLRPHEMKLIELRRELHKLQLDNADSGGLKLKSSREEAVLAGGGLANPEIGFSAPLRMDDPEMQAMRAKRLGRTLHALNVAIGADDPMMGMGLPSSARMNPIMNLRNVSDDGITVTPVFRYQAGRATKTFALKALRLNSQQTARIDVLPYWQSGQIPSRVSSGSLEITYTGRVGSLLASVTSVDQTGTYVFDSKIDNKLAAGFHGEYWSTEGDNNTSITIKNITDKPATGWVSLQYDAGRGEYELPPLTLQPAESHMIDLKMIQMERMPGASGEFLPENAVFGGMKLREEPGGRHFLIDAVVFNPKTATCGVCGYGCLYPSSMNIPLGTYLVQVNGIGVPMVVYAHMCDGTNQQGWECTCSFSSDATSIATVGAACESHGTGMSPGGTTFRSTASDVPGPHCGEQTLHASCPVTVNPAVAITGLHDIWYFAGQTPAFYPITQTLNATPAGATSYIWTIVSETDHAKFAGNGGLTITTTTNQTDLTPISKSGATQDVQVQVTVNGVTSPSFGITVHALDRMVPGPIEHVSDSARGFESHLQYAVRDQFNTAPPYGTYINETLGPNVNDYANCNWPPGPPGSAPIDAGSGLFQDNMAPPIIFLDIVPMPFSPGPTLSGTKVLHLTQSWQVGSSNTGAGYTMQTDRAQFYLDHGLHLLIVSPVP